MPICLVVACTHQISIGGPARANILSRLSYSVSQSGTGEECNTTACGSVVKSGSFRRGRGS